MSRKPMGLHINGHGHEDMIRRYVDAARPPVMKFLGDGANPELMDYCRARGAKVVFRSVLGDDGIGADGAIEHIIQRGGELAGHWDYLEFGNEEMQGRDDEGEWDRLCRLMRKAMVACEQRGWHACILNTSTGQPELRAVGKPRWDRPESVAMLKQAAVGGHIVGAHEYYRPRPWQGVSGEPGQSSQTAWAFPGKARGWWMLRFVRTIEEWRALGIPLPMIVISEAGRDDVSGTPGTGKGWRDEPVTPDGDFASFMGGYCKHLAAWPEVLGVVDFGFSTAQPEKWGSFDLASNDRRQFDRMIEVMAALEGTPPPSPPTPPESTMLEGIDVSHWQGRMDWHKAKGAGIKFVWMKAGEGSTGVDPEFARNALGAASVGVLWGPYHYYRNGIDPVAQADHFATLVRRGPVPTLPPALDFEDTTGAVDTAAMRRYIDRVTALLGRPVIYTGAWWWTPARLGGLQPWAKLLPLWVADYEGTVSVPADWGPPPGWTIHQYTSSGDGRAFGAESQRIDRNRYKGTVDQLAALRIPPPGMPTPQPGEPIDVGKLWAEAAANQAIRLNPGAGLQRAILAAGLVPTSNEWDYDESRIAQRAEALAGGPAAVFVFDKATGRVVRYNQP